MMASGVYQPRMLMMACVMVVLVSMALALA
jgi:hypothetical protein